MATKCRPADIPFQFAFDWRRGVRMEITESSYPVFCACRLFGYAPYRIRRNKSGRVVHIRRSRALSAYGLAAITTLGEQQ